MGVCWGGEATLRAKRFPVIFPAKLKDADWEGGCVSFTRERVQESDNKRTKRRA